MSNQDREELVYQAKICEQIERYEKMLNLMKKILDFPQELSAEERNLLSVAYKNSVSPKRTAWRIIDNQEKKEEAKSDQASGRHLELLKTFKKKVEKELDETCNDIIQTIENTLTPNAKDASSKVFYMKMKGDYYRYISEYNNGQDRNDIIGKANQAYTQAMSVAQSEMETTDPIRLGLSLNYSVFHYEIKNNPQEACKMAKTSFDEAIADIENIKDEHYKDSTTIMQLMRDNLTLWTQELEEGDKDEDN